MTKTIPLNTLKDMAKYALAHPPCEPFKTWGDAVVVYKRPTHRIKVQWEITSDKGHSLMRSEVLCEAAVHPADHDAAQFATSLFAAMEDELSIRELQHLTKRFTEALAERLAHRDASLLHSPLHNEAQPGISS